MSRKMVKKCLVRLPDEIKAWLAQEASRNASSQNSEIIRCIRARMDMLQQAKAAG
ncbi:Arc family DNA-binding protein [Bradyrhizobium lablabi]|uniref:Arc family DNA-binding protein n=1 Tax=Bradyrhizobium lablabi TaxID=722472 RepID=UPI001BA5BD3E|nr:Arc family DNA-binding protein [Bradyrhizobium lablabi]MBR0691592.1 Arc family DNA-binding protein [Bradyrhizobium lablabi]